MSKTKKEYPYGIWEALDSLELSVFDVGLFLDTCPKNSENYFFLHFSNICSTFFDILWVCVQTHPLYPTYHTPLIEGYWRVVSHPAAKNAQKKWTCIKSQNGLTPVQEHCCIKRKSLLELSKASNLSYCDVFFCNMLSMFRIPRLFP